MGFLRHFILDHTWSKAVQQAPESDSDRTVTHPKKKSGLCRFIGSTLGGITRVLRKKYRRDVLVSENLKAKDASDECAAPESSNTTPPPTNTTSSKAKEVEPSSIETQKNQPLLTSVSALPANEPVLESLTETLKTANIRSAAPPTHQLSTSKNSSQQPPDTGSEIRDNGDAQFHTAATMEPQAFEFEAVENQIAQTQVAELQIFELDASKTEATRPELVEPEVIETQVTVVKVESDINVLPAMAEYPTIEPSTTIKPFVVEAEAVATQFIETEGVDPDLNTAQDVSTGTTQVIQQSITESPVMDSPTEELLVTKLALVENVHDTALVHGQKDSKMPSETASPETKKIKDPIWGTVNQIPDQDFATLAMAHAPHGAEKAVVVGCKSGLHSRVVIIEYLPTSLGVKRCIRVPASGWEGQWSDLDKFQLTGSVHTMMFLKKHTSMPIPEIFHWDTERDNAIRAPHTIMSFMEGQAPLSVWQGDVYARPSLPNKVSSPLELEKYRAEYLKYLQAACGGEAEDWKLTEKSAMFESIIDAISCQDEERMVIILKAVMGVFLPRVGLTELVRQIGAEDGGDGDMGEEMIAFFVRGFEKVFGTEEVTEDQG